MSSHNSPEFINLPEDEQIAAYRATLPHLAEKALQAYLSDDEDGFRWATAIHDDIQGTLTGEWSYESALRGFEPLTEEERKNYKFVVLELDPAEPLYQDRVKTVMAALKEEGIDVATDIIDVNSECEGAVEQCLVLRSNSDNNRERGAQAALFWGATNALKWEVPRKSLYEKPSPSSPASDSMLATARDLIRPITQNPDLYTSFKEYYGGLRWGMDQEKFIYELFTQAAEFDPAVLDKQLTNDDVVALSYQLDTDTTFEQRQAWRELSLEEILQEQPDLDYRRLADPVYSSSEQGQALKEAYRKLIGYKQADLYRASGRNLIDKNGLPLPKPAVPLSTFPIVEALTVASIAQTHPRRKYSFAPQEELNLILDSDSMAAQWALVDAINSRTPKEFRYVLDGPSEFQHKQQLVAEVIRSFRKSFDNLERSEALKNHLLAIFEAYTGDGAIAQDAKFDYFDSIMQDRQPTGADSYRVKDIVSDILSAGIASPYAHEFIARYFPKTAELQDIVDPLRFDNKELKLILLEALSLAGEHSDPAIFEQLGSVIFGREKAILLAHIADSKVEASRLWNTPAARLARNSSYSPYSKVSSDEMTPEYLAAKAAYEAAMNPVDSLHEEYRDVLNDLLLDEMRAVLKADARLEKYSAGSHFFKKLLDRVYLGDGLRQEALPEIYHQLIELSHQPETPAHIKSSIAWKISEKYRHSFAEQRKLLPTIILDLYELALGTAENGEIYIDEESPNILAAAHHLAANNRGLFGDAKPSEIMRLEMYHNAIKNLANSDDGPIPLSDQDENIRHALNYSESMQKLYAEFLHFEEVKQKPHIYYPWLMQEMRDFWFGIHREHDDRYQQMPEINQLHSALDATVKRFAALKESDFTEDFDCFEQGGLDKLLIACYQNMVIPHEIKYNTTVWQKGLPFLHTAVAAMPDALVEQFQETYAGSPFVGYLEQVRAHYNKAR